MSYPGYPGHQNNYPSSQAPYPQQTGGAPYPSANQPYPQPGGVFPPSLGFNMNTPMYMPSCPQNSGYPAQSNAYPPGRYPPPPSGGSQHSYPSSNGGSAYPSSHSGGNSYPSYSPAPSGGAPHSSYPPAPSGGAPHSSYPSAHSGGAPHSSYPPAPSGGAPHSSYPAPSGGAPYGSYPNQGGAPHYGGQHHGHSPQSGGHYGGYKKGTPTVYPAQPFDPRQDAEVLRKAMKGFGTDEKAIINVLTKRTNAQRLEIIVQFKTLYGKDLIDDLKSELSGNFENVIVAMMTPLPVYYAKELHRAVSGLGTDEESLIEVMCTLSNAEIRTIRQAYQHKYSETLESALRGDSSGTFRRLMTSLCCGGRDESMMTDQNAAFHDAQQLMRAGELRLGTDESTFNQILCQRNYAQLQLIFHEYQKLTGHDIETAIKNEFSGNSEDCLLGIIRAIKSKPAFFAKCLHKYMAGMGTDDKNLIRVLVTRCEIDMVEIKREYQALYGKSLREKIHDECSGDYKHCLYALIGEP